MTFSLRIKVHLVWGKNTFASSQGRRNAESWKKGKAGKFVDIGKHLWVKVQNFEYDVIGNFIAFMTKNKEDLYTELGIRKRSCGENKSSVWNKYVVVKIDTGWCQTLCNQSVLWNIQKYVSMFFNKKLGLGFSTRLFRGSKRRGREIKINFKARLH